MPFGKFNLCQPCCSDVTKNDNISSTFGCYTCCENSKVRRFKVNISGISIQNPDLSTTTIINGDYELFQRNSEFYGYPICFNVLDCNNTNNTYCSVETPTPFAEIDSYSGKAFIDSSLTYKIFIQVYPQIYFDGVNRNYYYTISIQLFDNSSDVDPILRISHFHLGTGFSYFENACADSFLLNETNTDISTSSGYSLLSSSYSINITSSIDEYIDMSNFLGLSYELDISGLTSYPTLNNRTYSLLPEAYLCTASPYTFMRINGSVEFEIPGVVINILLYYSPRKNNLIAIISFYIITGPFGEHCSHHTASYFNISDTSVSFSFDVPAVGFCPHSIFTATLRAI